MRVPPGWPHSCGARHSSGGRQITNKKYDMSEADKQSEKEKETSGCYFRQAV